MGRWLWIALAVLFSCILHAHSIAVMSVDIGGEWIKVGIVSPGIPMEIVLNKESKRKTPAAIAFRNGERLFGEDALNLGVRFPQNTYSYILPLLGQKVNSSVVQRFKTQFPYYKIEEDPERGTVVFRHDDETRFTPEELIAMMLQQCKRDAEAAVDQAVTEVVLTVPAYFGQTSRRAYLSAAQLAGLKPLQLINDYMAVAINYGIFRRKDFNESAQNVIFYDMGATSTVASVISYSIGKGRDADPQATVLGVSVDRTLGGLEMQLRLRDYLGKKFNEMKKTPNDVFKNPRALAKLFKEAGRVKNVLSANNDHYAQVEGLLDEQDFKLQVTREQFEELCTDLFARSGTPITAALEIAGLTMESISQVVLVGAGTRVPKVQDALTKATGVTLSKNINADEAAAMGAVYKAADLSSGFKVKRFVTKDAVIYPIQVVFERKVDTEGTPENPVYKTVKRTLFGRMNPYPQKKVLTFNKNSEDFSFNVNYAELDYLKKEDIDALGSLSLSQVALSGIVAALEKNNGPNVEAKGVKAHFNMDESGILQLVSAELSFEKTITAEEEKAQKEEDDVDSTLSKLGNTISKLFSSDEQKADSASEEKVEEADPSTTTTPAPSSKSEKNETAPSEAPKPKVTIIKETLKINEEKLDLVDLDGNQFASSKSKLTALDEIDEKRKRHEGALNALESFILDSRMRLETEEFIAAGSESEREALSSALSKAADWLEEEGFTAETEDLEKQLKTLHDSAKAMLRRVDEHRNRPEALAALEKTIEGSQKFLAMAENQTKNAPEEERIFTEIEVTTLKKAIKDTEEWKTKKVEEQAALPLSENPKLTVRAIVEKMTSLDREVKYLVNKAKNWRPPKKPKDDKKGEKNATESAESEKVLDDGVKVEVNDTKPAEDTKEKEEPKETEPVLELDGAVSDEPTLQESESKEEESKQEKDSQKTPKEEL
ncbi:hypoxia up-regulated protein 1 isoform X2 [Neocloeon triangulifer]|uniref:hypoxia up-regulated protein 1 isoform X2 n=1 Tax=Neocloeon triangulifer TaxID=2078957 RepID=UPI00286F8979|nr:hypoxia up-regulated protein 1 isoform X2 [Neocloeon triangulifer]